MTGHIEATFGRRFFRETAGVLFVVLLILGSGQALARSAPQDDTELRTRAMALWQENNYAEAVPLLEKLASAHPTDVLVLERLGGGLASTAVGVTDLEERKQVLLRARGLLLRAQELGDHSDYLKVMLEKIPENGEPKAFSDRKEVDDALREGEMAFGRSDYVAALAAYERVLQLDPKNYEAALFTGDVYFNRNQTEKAGEWFAKAIAIDPDRETAYRYWGDALLRGGKMDDAKAQFIDAVVAEPYQQTSWTGLNKWARKNQAAIAHPKIEIPASVSPQAGNTNITIDINSLGKPSELEYGIIYGGSRITWQREKFQKEYPQEKTYRHSLPEEVEALGAVAQLVADDAKDHHKRKHIDSSLLTLLKLRDQGMLEPYVLLSKPDQGIAQDYAAYRDSHRDKLRQYIAEWLIQPASAKN